MNALQSPLKRLTELFDTVAKSRKALKRAKDERESARQDVDRLMTMIQVATIPDPVLHVTRIQVTPAELATWKEQHAMAQTVFEAANAKVLRLEADNNTCASDLSREMTLPAVKAAHANARNELSTAERVAADLGGKISRTEAALVRHLAELEHLREAVALPDCDALTALPALQAHREKVSGAEMLIEILKSQRIRALANVEEAKASSLNWERRLWREIADDVFTPDELGILRERIKRGYAASLLSGDIGRHPLAYVARLFKIDEMRKENASVQASLRKEYDMP